MTKNLSHITVNDLEAWARKQDRSKNNPTINHGCVYNGPNNTHCIAGQFFVDNGFVVPDAYNQKSTVTRLIDRGVIALSEEVGSILHSLQKQADRATAAKNNEPWGYAIDKVFGDE